MFLEVSSYLYTRTKATQTHAIMLPCIDGFGKNGIGDAVHFCMWLSVAGGLLPPTGIAVPRTDVGMDHSLNETAMFFLKGPIGNDM